MSEYEHPTVVAYEPLDEPGHPRLWVVLHGRQASVLTHEDRARDCARSVENPSPRRPPALTNDFLDSCVGALRKNR